MKTILFNILLVLIFGCVTVKAQDLPGDPSDYSKLTNEPADKAKTYFEVYDWSNSNSPKIYIIPYEKLEEFFAISGDQTIVDNWSFTKPLQLALDGSSTLELGLKFVNTANGVRLGYSKGGNLYIMPNIDDLSAVGIGDTADVARQSGTNVFSGTNTVDGLLDVRNGELRITSESVNPSQFTGDMRFYYSETDSAVYANVVDGSNNKFRLRLIDNIYFDQNNTSGSGSNAIIATGTQGGVTSVVTRTAGGTSYSGTADNELHVYPVGQVPSVHKDGKTFTNGSNGFFEISVMSYVNQGQDPIIIKYPESRKVDDMIDKRLSFAEPVFHNTTSDTLDFASSDPIAGKFGSQFLQTIYLKNYQPNFIVSCFVQSGEGVTFNFGSVNIKWLNGILPPAFDDQKIWTVAFQYFNPTTVLGSFGYYE